MKITQKLIRQMPKYPRFICIFFFGINLYYFSSYISKSFPDLANTIFTFGLPTILVSIFIQQSFIELFIKRLQVIFTSYWLILILAIIAPLNLFVIKFDNDNDGASYLTENVWKTNNNNPDGDFDLIKDGSEIAKSEVTNLFNPREWDVDHNKIIDICDLITIQKKGDKALKNKVDFNNPFEIISICKESISNDRFLANCNNPNFNLTKDIQCKDILMNKIHGVVTKNFNQYEE